MTNSTAALVAAFGLSLVGTVARADAPAPSTEPPHEYTCKDGTKAAYSHNACKDHGGIVGKAKPLTECTDGTYDVYNDHVCAGHGGQKKR